MTLKHSYILATPITIYFTYTIFTLIIIIHNTTIYITFPMKENKYIINSMKYCYA